MPSIGHVAVGLAAGRLHAGAEGPRLLSAAIFTALSTFPDLDVLARALGATAGSPWLHRGALHSLAAAAAAATIATLAVSGLGALGGLGRSRARLWATAFVVAASHGLLDTLTRGGSGVMLLWPAGLARVLAPWALVPASPMGLRLLSARGAEVMLGELVLFAPLLLVAAWPSRRVGPALGPAPR